MSLLKVLMVGDVVGAPGRAMFQKHIPKIRAEHGIDLLVVNGENASARGRGITPKNIAFFKHLGVDVITSGNHIWAAREVYEYLDQDHTVLRPANFPSQTPGTGVALVASKGVMVGVINLQGRVFMRELVDCPFRTADSLLTYLKDKTRIVLVDFHAETTSEKAALGFYLDGRVSCVVGTHTHIQTADEQILPKGTGFITDLSMVGALHSSLGVKVEPIISHMLTQLPIKFEIETKPPYVLCGVIVEIATDSGRVQAIKRVRIIEREALVCDEN